LFTPIDFKIEGNKAAELRGLGMPYGLQSAMVDTGVHIAIPSGYVGMIKSKSGLNCNRGLVAEGVIDSGYTGSIVVKLVNLSQYETHFKRGDKIAQLVIMPISTEGLEVVNQLEDTKRGSNGFGSTGR
jgi:dUTP pyrophosphatase